MRHNTLFLNSTKTKKLFPLFLIPIVFIFMSDAILSYIFPIIVEKRLESNTLLGIIMSMSSVAGLFCDLWYPFLFKNRTWKFQLTLGILIASLFPLSIYLSYFFLPILMFVIASMVWGMYYDMIVFSEENFITEEESSNMYTRDWAIMNVVILLTWNIGPILGEYISNTSKESQLFIVLLLQLIGFVVALIISSGHKKTNNSTHHKSYHKNARKELFKLFLNWKLLSTNIFAFLATLFVLKLTESAYWMFGGLYAQSIGIPEGSHFIILSTLTVALLIGSTIISYLNIRKNKEIISTVSLLISGIFLVLSFNFTSNIPVLIACLFISSLFISIVGPLRSSLFSEYIKDLGPKKQSAIGLSCAIGSLSYIIGPTLLGIISDYVGYAKMFAILGAITVTLSVLLLIKKSRK